ncbi:hypothetical protein SETIT_6G078800v2 [Setaria italica]|uniref:Uncharacterized protein n=1 Tax=Setaria italica TaxID=4555 RepID=A0A368RJ62_SETIT|nr:hypothetical protein SETIT_6G078800v2 [Setaria italica]
MIAVCLEEVVRPLREEASTIKLWLARVANHLECVVTSDMAKLFGPCSPVYRSPTPSILTSLAAVCTSADSLVPLGTSTTEMHQDSPTEQTLLQTMTSVEDVVLVEDASNDEEAILDAHGTIDDPIFLITIKDNPSYSMVEVKVEEAQMIMEDPPIEVISSPSTKVRNGEELGSRRRCKSYDRSSLRRSARVAQRDVLKIRGVIQDYADRLKKLLPLDDLKPLVDLKGHAFLELLAELSLSLR